MAANPKDHPPVSWREILSILPGQETSELPNGFKINNRILRFSYEKNCKIRNQSTGCMLAGQPPPPLPSPLNTWSLYVHCTVLYTLTLVLPPPPPCHARPLPGHALPRYSA
jgi:hypothetical protein